jgi:hypothetical protein
MWDERGKRIEGDERLVLIIERSQHYLETYDEWFKPWTNWPKLYYSLDTSYLLCQLAILKKENDDLRVTLLRVR